MDSNNAPKGDKKEEKGSEQRGKRLSNYGYQLKEKQNAKKIYGMRERQFRRFYSIASKSKGDKGAKLIELLEQRIDNVVYRLGWAASRSMARQVVNHRHILVNGKVLNIPSYIVKVGDKLEFKSDKIPSFLKKIEMPKIETPKWLKKSGSTGEVVDLPKRAEVDVPIKESLIVELYSK